MASIIIQSENNDNLDLLSKLAKKLGDRVSLLTEEQSEDMALGNIIGTVKTGKTTSREIIMQKLSS